MTASFRDDPARKDDLFLLRYSTPAMTAGPVDKYVERGGPFDREVYDLFLKMHQALVEHGESFKEPSSRPFYTYAYSGFHHHPIAYRVLNCLVEQEARIACAGEYDLFYELSIMGRYGPASGAYEVLSGITKSMWFYLDPFKKSIVPPEIKRYENKDLLKPNDFSSISDLEGRLRLIATKEKKNWKWSA